MDIADNQENTSHALAPWVWSMAGELAAGEIERGARSARGKTVPVPLGAAAKQRGIIAVPPRANEKGWQITPAFLVPEGGLEPPRL